MTSGSPVQRRAPGHAIARLQGPCGAAAWPGSPGSFSQPLPRNLCSGGCVQATGDPCWGPLFTAKRARVCLLSLGLPLQAPTLTPNSSTRPSPAPDASLSQAPRRLLKPQGDSPARWLGGRLSPIEPSRSRTWARDTFFRERFPHPPPSLERNTKATPCHDRLDPTRFMAEVPVPRLFCRSTFPLPTPRARTRARVPHLPTPPPREA